MNIIEYKKEMARINEEKEMELNKLASDYVHSNNTVNCGNVISDHIGSIIVSKIKVSLFMGKSMPRAIYEGAMLTKKGVVRVDGKTRCVHQSNVKG